MNRYVLTLIAPLTGALLTGCAATQPPVLNMRTFALEGGVHAGINVTDGSRRIAVIFPDGHICSELAPPAIMQDQRAASVNVTAPHVTVGGGVSNSTSAVKLAESSDKVECLRLAIFHACGLASQDDMPSAKVAELYMQIVNACGHWDDAQGDGQTVQAGGANDGDDSSEN